MVAPRASLRWTSKSAWSVSTYRFRCPWVRTHLADGRIRCSVPRTFMDPNLSTSTRAARSYRPGGPTRASRRLAWVFRVITSPQNHPAQITGYTRIGSAAAARLQHPDKTRSRAKMPEREELARLVSTPQDPERGKDARTRLSVGTKPLHLCLLKQVQCKTRSDHRDRAIPCVRPPCRLLYGCATAPEYRADAVRCQGVAPPLRKARLPKPAIVRGPTLCGTSCA